MEIKSYWVFVAGFVLLFMFVLLIVTSRRNRHTHKHATGYLPKPMQSHWLGPGGTRRLWEGFASNPTFTMFGVDWCPHCVKAKPLFESLGPTVTIDGHVVNLQYVNPEQDKAAAQGYTIEGYPTFYLEKDGQKTKYGGPRTADGFRAFLKKELSS